MSGPTPLTATHRLVVLYTVQGIQHHQVNYCEAISSADPLGYDLVGRVGVGNAGLSNVPDHIFAPMAPFWPSAGASFDGCRLDQRSGTTWIPLMNAPTTITPSGSFNYEPAMGVGLTGKSVANQNMPVYLFEGGFGNPSKFSSYAALSSAFKALVDIYWAVGRAGVIDDPWNWRTSRNNNKELRWLAVVIDTNEKLRRKRGIK